MMEESQHNNQEEKLNYRRRALLKLAFFGSATFVLAKILGPLNHLSSTSNYKNFRVVDKGRELYVYDKEGNELLVIEKDASAGNTM
jgi:hypothetical protein